MTGLPDFDGATYRHALDHERLGAQLLRVAQLMGDGGWRTLREIARTTDDPEASVSARLRDLRKRKFGGYTVERERLTGGLYRYRVVKADQANDDDWGEGARKPVEPEPEPRPTAEAVPEPKQSDLFSLLT